MKITTFVFSVTVVCLFGLFSGSLYAAEGLIKKVSFEQGDGNIESVIFHLDGPWLPKVFALKGENPRVVFDFMNTKLSRTVPSTIDARGSMVRKVRLGRHSNKTRVVIDLVAGGAFNFDQQFDKKNNILTIQLFSVDYPENDAVNPAVELAADSIPEAVPAMVAEETATVAVAEPVSLASTEEPVTEVEAAAGESVEQNSETTTPPLVEEDNPVADPVLLELSFEDTSSKGEMVLFKLNGFYPPTVTGEEEGTPLVICNFAGTRLGEEVQKSMEIGGEFIQRLQVVQPQGSDAVRVTVELVPSKNYDLQQVFFKEDNLFVIIVNSYESMDIKQ